ncbi:MAG: HDOD domain-containing protein [Gammaproteobacteria bacterium]
MSTAEACDTRPLSGLFASAYRDIMTSKKRLPSMPDVAIRLRAAMQDENHSVRTVARVVQADASTAAYLIHVANSPIYRGVSHVEDVEMGISRLGLRTTRNLVTAHAMRSMFQTKSKALAKIMHHTWKQSARTAAFGAILARRDRLFEPDRAMLAGLLQDIGILPLLGALEGNQRALRDLNRIVPTMNEFSPKVGVALLKHWGFDGELIEVARSRLDYSRDPQPAPQLADLILVARVLANIVQSKSDEMPNVEKVPAFAKLKLGQEEFEELRVVLSSGDEEVREMLQLLGVG